MKQKPLYTARVSVWAPSLNRGRMLEEVFDKVEGSDAVKRRLRLGPPLDGGQGPSKRGSRRKSSSGLYVCPSGVAFVGQGLEIKDRDGSKKEEKRAARTWSST